MNRARGELQLIRTTMTPITRANIDHESANPLGRRCRMNRGIAKTHRFREDEPAAAIVRPPPPRPASAIIHYSRPVASNYVNRAWDTRGDIVAAILAHSSLVRGVVACARARDRRRVPFRPACVPSSPSPYIIGSPRCFIRRP